MEDNNFNRRQFLKVSLGSLGFLSIPKASYLPFSFTQSSADELDPHYFLQVFIEGGMDFSYLFDARPMDMTAKGKIQNYIKEDPVLLETASESCFATKLTGPLKKHFDSFSVLNGVLMATGFDGHNQNVNFFLAGDPFGGESYLPHFNTHNLHIDAIRAGDLFGEFSNTGNIVPLDSSSAKILLAKLKEAPPIQKNDKLFSFLQSRFDANNRSNGNFSKASLALSASHQDIPELADALSRLELGDGNDQEKNFLNLLVGLFKNKVTRCGLLTVDVGNFSVDTHDFGSASKQPAMFEDIAKKIAAIFEHLRNTPYDDKRSMLDVTTVVVGSEFGRTMRQEGRKIDETGTDHNPLSNTILIGGKGIKPGLVIGQSDFRTAEEEASGAHVWLDKEKLKIMGAPFDYVSERVRSDKPQIYKPQDYLQMGAVANTLYSLFGVEQSKYRKFMRNGDVIPVLHSLLA